MFPLDFCLNALTLLQWRVSKYHSKIEKNGKICAELCEDSSRILSYSSRIFKCDLSIIHELLTMFVYTKSKFITSRLLHKVRAFRNHPGLREFSSTWLPILRAITIKLLLDLPRNVSGLSKCSNFYTELEYQSTAWKTWL